MLTFLSFIRVLYLKQSSNILRCFFSLKLKKICLTTSFHIKMNVHTPEKDQIKYFARNWLGKITFTMCKLLLDLPAVAL